MDNMLVASHGPGSVQTHSVCQPQHDRFSSPAPTLAPPHPLLYIYTVLSCILLMQGDHKNQSDDKSSPELLVMFQQQIVNSDKKLTCKTVALQIDTGACSGG